MYFRLFLILSIRLILILIFCLLSVASYSGDFLGYVGASSPSSSCTGSSFAGSSLSIIYASPSSYSGFVTKLDVSFSSNVSSRVFYVFTASKSATNFTVLNVVPFSPSSQTGQQTVDLSTPLQIDSGNYIGYFATDYSYICRATSGSYYYKLVSSPSSGAYTYESGSYTPIYIRLHVYSDSESQKDNFTCDASSDPIAYYSSVDFCSDYQCCHTNYSNMSLAHPLWSFCDNNVMFGDEAVDATNYYNNNCTTDTGGDADGDTGTDTGNTTGAMECGLPGLQPCYVYDEKVEQQIKLLLAAYTQLDDSFKTIDSPLRQQVEQLVQLKDAYDTSTTTLDTALKTVDNSINNSITSLSTGMKETAQQQTTQISQGFTTLSSSYEQGTNTVTSAVNTMSTSVNDSMNSVSGVISDLNDSVRESNAQTLSVQVAMQQSLDALLADVVDFSDMNHADLQQLHVDLGDIQTSITQSNDHLQQSNDHLQNIHTEILDINADTNLIRDTTAAIEEDTTALVRDQAKLLALFDTDGEIRKILQNDHVNLGTFACPQYKQGARLQTHDIEFNCNSVDQYKCHVAEYLFKIRCANYLYQMETLELKKGANASYTCPAEYRPMLLDGQPVCRYKSHPYCSRDGYPMACYSTVLNFDCNPNGGNAFTPLVDISSNGFICDTRANSVKHAAIVQYLSDISDAVTPLEYQEYRCANGYIPSFKYSAISTIEPICEYNDQSNCGSADGQSVCSVTANITCAVGVPKLNPSINGFTCERQHRANEHNDLVQLLQQIAQQDVKKAQQQETVYQASEAFIHDWATEGQQQLAGAVDSLDSDNFGQDVEVMGVSLPLTMFALSFGSLSTFVTGLIYSSFYPSCVDPIISVSAFDSDSVSLFSGYCALFTPIRTIMSWYLIYLTMAASITMYSRALERMSYQAMGRSASPSMESS